MDQSQNKLRTILITGGAGFIGVNMISTLLNDDSNFIICVDNLSSGSYENIAKFISNPNFRFENHDISNKFDIPCDIIINLACPASPPFYQSDPLATIATCYQGTKNCLENAKQHSAKFLHASTSEVYGDPLEHPQTETYKGNVNTFGPRACYDEGKRIAETLCYEYGSLYDLNICVFRIFNTYGPGMALNDGRVVTNILSSFISKKPVPMYGDGTQTRSFCFVDDLVQGILLLLESDKKLNYPINIGNPDEIQIIELIKIFYDIVDQEPNFIQMSLPIDDPLKRKPDITKMKKMFGWAPQTSLRDGLRKMIETYHLVQ
jgi:UDP-glucuronate decarboxylase